MTLRLTIFLLIPHHFIIDGIYILTCVSSSFIHINCSQQPTIQISLISRHFSYGRVGEQLLGLLRIIHPVSGTPKPQHLLLKKHGSGRNHGWRFSLGLYAFFIYTVSISVKMYLSNHENSEDLIVVLMKKIPSTGFRRSHLLLCTPLSNWHTDKVMWWLWRSSSGVKTMWRGQWDRYKTWAWVWNCQFPAIGMCMNHIIVLSHYPNLYLWIIPALLILHCENPNIGQTVQHRRPVSNSVGCHW